MKLSSLIFVVLVAVGVCGAALNFFASRANRVKHYVVSYRMSTVGGGNLVGSSEMSWSPGATRDQITEIIRKNVVADNAAKGEPEPVGDLVILGVFERPWASGEKEEKTP